MTNSKQESPDIEKHPQLNGPPLAEGEGRMPHWSAFWSQFSRSMRRTSSDIVTWAEVIESWKRGNPWVFPSEVRDWPNFHWKTLTCRWDTSVFDFRNV